MGIESSCLPNNRLHVFEANQLVQGSIGYGTMIKELDYALCCLEVKDQLDGWRGTVAGVARGSGTISWNRAYEKDDKREPARSGWVEPRSG